MKLPAYPRTKPSGVEWLGDVPEHWEVKRHTRRAVDLRPEGATTSQPGATPWVCDSSNQSALKGRDNGRTRDTESMNLTIRQWPARDCAALSGLGLFGAQYPGRCPGLDYFGPVGAKKGGQP